MPISKNLRANFAAFRTVSLIERRRRQRGLCNQRYPRDSSALVGPGSDFAATHVGEQRSETVAATLRPPGAFLSDHGRQASDRVPRAGNPSGREPRARRARPRPGATAALLSFDGRCPVNSPRALSQRPAPRKRRRRKDGRDGRTGASYATQHAPVNSLGTAVFRRVGNRIFHDSISMRSLLVPGFCP
jgi:hypothetical protein